MLLTQIAEQGTKVGHPTSDQNRTRNMHGQFAFIRLSRQKPEWESSARVSRFANPYPVP